MIDVPRKKIFLSHAGQDAKFALRLGRQIESQWAFQVGDNVDVFCTSKAEHRFKGLGQGSDWQKEYPRWEEDLRQYLRQHLVGSDAYILLVTRQSIQKNSGWVAFEIDVASEQAVERQRFFFPCVAEGATLSDLPDKARMFQGIELASQDAVSELVELSARGHP